MSKVYAYMFISLLLSQTDSHPFKSVSSKNSFSEKVDLVSADIDVTDISNQDPAASIRSKVTLSEDCEVVPDIIPSPEEGVDMEDGSRSGNCMTFHNVSYKVNGLKNFKWVSKPILHNVRYMYMYA